MSGSITLEVANLGKVFGGSRGLLGLRRAHPVRAVDDVSFIVRRRETLGIVGESGSGKSTTARLLLRLIEPTSGVVRLNGEDLRSLPAGQLRQRRRGMQMVFQDPFASLNPRLAVGYQLGEPLLLHGLCRRREVEERVGTLLVRVGLSPGHARLYPHQFSGGQRQRIAIARALAVEPDLIVADEAVSALDVSVRAQILNLIEDIKHASELSMVFISHDLGVVRHVADRVAVMFLGRIVEIGPVAEVFTAPRHPYTRTLLEAMPIAIPGRRRGLSRPALPGAAGAGCSFAARCALVRAECRASMPPLIGAGGRASACFRAGDVQPFVIDAGQVAGRARQRLRRLQDRYLAAGAAGSGE